MDQETKQKENIEITTTRDFIEGKHNKDNIHVRLYAGMFYNGLAAQLKDTDFKVLLALAIHMDQEGVCFPTQKRIAKMIGKTEKTIERSIGRLKVTKVNGKPLLTVKLVEMGKVFRNVYKLHPVAQISIFEGKVEG